MATFQQQGTITDAILSQRSGGGITVPPPAPVPESGITPPFPVDVVISRPPGPYAFGSGSSCLSRGDVLNRLQYRSYQGVPATAAGGAYPYVLTDASDLQHYRVVFAVDLMPVVSSTSVQGSLYLIPAGTKLPIAVDGTDPFFLNYSAVSAIRNYAPPARGIRIDNWDITNAAQQSTLAGQSKAMMFLGDFFIIPPGWVLMGYDISGPATVPGVGAYLEIRIAFSELALNEDFSWS